MQRDLTAEHARYAREVTDHYKRRGTLEEKLLNPLGFDAPLPPLPPGVPHDDLLFCFLVLSLLAPVILVIVLQGMAFIVRRVRGSQERGESERGWRAMSPIALALFVGKFVVVAVFCLLLRFLLLQSNETSPMFVLGVTAEATPKEIGRAYRRLAKLWHPSKNKDPEANDKWSQIRDAYHTFYDGDMGTDVSIGLPTFISDRRNGFLVLATYFLLVVIFLLAATKVTRDIRKEVLEGTSPRSVTQTPTAQQQQRAASRQRQWVQWQAEDRNELLGPIGQREADDDPIDANDDIDDESDLQLQAALRQSSREHMRRPGQHPSSGTMRNRTRRGPLTEDELLQQALLRSLSDR